MKSLLGFVLTVLAIAPVAATACPKIEGSYQCTTAIRGITKNADVTKSDGGGISTYTLDGTEIVIDGAQRSPAVLPLLIKLYLTDITFASECRNGGIEMNGKAKLRSNGEDVLLSGFISDLKTEKMEISLSVTYQNKEKKTIGTLCTIRK